MFWYFILLAIIQFVQWCIPEIWVKNIKIPHYWSPDEENQLVDNPPRIEAAMWKALPSLLFVQLPKQQKHERK